MDNQKLIKDILADWMAAEQLSANELARRSGVPQPTITRILSGESKDPATRTLEPIASYFKRPVSDLRGETAHLTLAPIMFSRTDHALEQEVFSKRWKETASGLPLLSWTQAAKWNDGPRPWEVDDILEWLPCPVPHGPLSFVLCHRGITMEPDFRDGDYIFVDPRVEPVNGKHVVVALPGRDEALFRQLIFEDGQAYLKSLNAAWPEPVKQLPNEARIVGVVIFSGRIV